MSLKTLARVITIALGLSIPLLVSSPWPGPGATEAFEVDCAGRPDGLHRISISGAVYEIECRGGVLNGRMAMLDPGNGKPACRFEFQNGVVSGPFVAWHLDGTPAVEGTFRDNKLDGRLKFTGAGLFAGFRMESDFKDGKSAQPRVWDPQGRDVPLDRIDIQALMRESIRDNGCAVLLFMGLGRGG